MNELVNLAKQALAQNQRKTVAQPGRLTTLRELKKAIVEIEEKDPRLPFLMASLASCEDASKAGNWEFQKEVDNVKRLMRLTPNAKIWWTGMDGMEHGPCVIELVVSFNQRLWVWVESEGVGHWLVEHLIGTIKTESRS